MEREQWDERYRADELIWKVEPNRFLVEEVAGLVPGRALDLACGEGRNALWLAERGWQVTAVDFSAVGLEKARRLASASAHSFCSRRTPTGSLRALASSGCREKFIGNLFCWAFLGQQLCQ